MSMLSDDLGGLKGDQLRENFQEWLSPADPSVNYNSARDAYHDGTAVWFTQGQIFDHWKVSGSESLLWIHGKPDNPGKLINLTSSSVIHEIQGISPPAASQLAYFFFDFKDATKQDARALLTSFLVQLCDQSKTGFKHLFDMYSTHNNGTQQPSEGALFQCLENTLRGLGQVPIYLIIDALDESPSTSKVLGVPSSRQRVLEVIKKLVMLRLRNLHICVTSRHEFDISSALKQLASFKISLHDQDGQRDDITRYVSSVVYSDAEFMMKKWKTEDKELVVETLTKKSDGMFRWIICQLETLRHCFTRNVLRVLDELPKSLDETYERVLKSINAENCADAYRLLQCLTVAMRPLRVEELAEVLAIDYDEQALLAACSSLITIVNIDGSQVVQFSHFSVKEFLTSRRLSASSGDISCYYISLESAHTVLAQTCLSVLLWTNHRANKYTIEDHHLPLARYAARHWFDHAPFGKESSRVRKGMELLFDSDRPHFSAWLQLHDIDIAPSLSSTFYLFTPTRKSDATPLYYSALCGLHDLTEHLIFKHPEQVNAHGGYYVTPVVAALARKHLHVAQLLYDHGGG
ncbi:hypothetical protein BGW80DRAFT_1383030, partial [Lactifluus volemus]